MKDFVNTPLSLYAGLQDLKIIRSFVRHVALRSGVDPCAVDEILLATTEAVTNILVHGYRGEVGWLEVQVRREGDNLLVVLRDEAIAFDPTQILAPDLTVPLEDRPLGGLGVHLIRESMSRMVYRPLPRGGNELTLIKEGAIKK